MAKVTPFLMLNGQLEAGMEFYAATVPDSEIRKVARNGSAGPITSVESVVGAQVFMGYNAGCTSRPLKASGSSWTARTRQKSTNTGTGRSRPERSRPRTAGFRFRSVCRGRLSRGDSCGSSASRQ